MIHKNGEGTMQESLIVNSFFFSIPDDLICLIHKQ